MPALTICQALYVLCSRIQNRKEPLLLALILDQTLIYVKGHVPKLNLAIVQVYSKYPALLESKQHCLPTCRRYITDENTDNYTTETRLAMIFDNACKVYANPFPGIEVYRLRIGSHHNLTNCRNRLHCIKAKLWNQILFMFCLNVFYPSYLQSLLKEKSNREACQWYVNASSCLVAINFYANPHFV